MFIAQKWNAHAKKVGWDRFAPHTKSLIWIQKNRPIRSIGLRLIDQHDGGDRVDDDFDHIVVVEAEHIVERVGQLVVFLLQTQRAQHLDLHVEIALGSSHQTVPTLVQRSSLQEGGKEESSTHTIRRDIYLMLDLFHEQRIHVGDGWGDGEDHQHGGDDDEQLFQAGIGVDEAAKVEQQSAQQGARHGVKGRRQLEQHVRVVKVAQDFVVLVQTTQQVHRMFAHVGKLTHRVQSPAQGLNAQAEKTDIVEEQNQRVAIGLGRQNEDQIRIQTAGKAEYDEKDRSW